MSQRKNKQSPEDKVRAVAPELLDSAESMTVQELKVEIARRAMLYSESKEAEAGDEDLIAAKAEVKLLAEPYKADQKAAQTVISWLTKLVESRGAQ